MWPAIWMLGAACQTSSTSPYTWLSGTSGTPTGYYCPWSSDSSDAAEIDIAEGFGQLNEQLHNNGSGVQCRPSITWAGTMHTYELDWSAGSLTWKVDGTTECSTTMNVPSHPMFLIINTAVCSPGTVCGGSPTDANFPATTTVDYVHVSH
jgi:beta-glucanase (GH16 family)